MCSVTVHRHNIFTVGILYMEIANESGEKKSSVQLVHPEALIRAFVSVWNGTSDIKANTAITILSIKVVFMDNGTLHFPRLI